MRSLLFILAVVLGACGTAPRDGSSEATDRIAIQNATRAWAEAYNTRDSAKIVAFYEPDAVFWGTSMKSMASTPEAVAEYFKDAAKRPNARATIGEHEVRVLGDVAFSSGSNAFTDVRDGKPTVNAARFTMVFHKRNGVWRLVHHHSSRAP
jgi:uncharacterized protein (TIGR02246 family)